VGALVALAVRLDVHVDEGWTSFPREFFDLYLDGFMANDDGDEDDVTC